MKGKSDKINFFKKIYFSICKIKEYENLSKEGLRKSIYYIMDLVLICALIYASILTFQMKKNADGLQEYLEENFPNLTYKEEMLVSEKEERVILDNELVKVNFGGQLVIDTTTEYDTLISEYKNSEVPTILLTSNKYITINSQGTVSEYNYTDIIKTENKEETIIGKDYFVNLFSNISYSYYFCGYLVGSAIGTSIIIFIYNLLITGVTFIFCKIKKANVKFGEIYRMGLYAHTIAVFGYFILNFLPVTIGVYVQLLTLIIPVIYLSYVIYLNKA